VTARADGCELCEAVQFTTWYHEDELCWVADCEACDVPMVVWRSHGAAPPPTDAEQMLGELRRAAAARFGPDGFVVDPVMRQVPDHFHAHARRRVRRGSSAAQVPR
jgi:hypothetical protein